MTYLAPVEEMLFVMRHVAGLDVARRVGWLAAPDDDAIAAMLEQAGQFAADRWAVLNQPGDREGAVYDRGAVRTPKGFAAAYRDWIAGGWNGVTAPEAFGGAELPVLLGSALMEIWTSANMGFATCPVLTHGAVDALLAHASPALQERYLGRLVSGEWTATMNLTEPQAGSDLALLRCRAERAADGSYRLFGAKIFITYGEHDFADNIIHLVLARLPDGPAGTRGISLFLVPKILPDGSANDLRCTGIEHKMGIRASPTCSMSYGDGSGAAGWLVGEEHHGLACMFTMMNRARLATGLQGVAVGERALQQARSFAATRRQGRNEAGETVTIAAHPDVKRMVRSMHGAVLASRAIAYTTALAIDEAERRGRPEDAARAGLLTPITKACAGSTAFEVASVGVQVHGGMGYVEETGAAQHLRDARIIPIYEGTDGIQAIDLVTRKLMRDHGAAVRAEIGRLRAAAEMAARTQSLARLATRTGDAVEALAEATDWLLSPGCREAERLAVAWPYMALFGLAAGGGYLAAGAAAASDACLAAIRCHADHALTAAPGLARRVTDGADSILID
jgi:alkylation response protein AidB-like acyl-CoA dehydrogenase